MTAVTRIIDYFANRRWLVLVAFVTTVLGVINEVLDVVSNELVEVAGVDVGVWQLLPVVAAILGQVRANSNRYVDELRDALDEVTANAVFIASDGDGDVGRLP